MCVVKEHMIRVHFLWHSVMRYSCKPLAQYGISVWYDRVGTWVVHPVANVFTGR
jgi:hypothetical protein